MTPEEIVHRWLRLVTADAELSPYLIGVDRVRLAAHLTASVTAALAGEPADAWGGLGLSEEQRRRIGDYLVGVCWAADLPDGRIARVRRAVAR
jgi:hemoglobin